MATPERIPRQTPLASPVPRAGGAVRSGLRLLACLVLLGLGGLLGWQLKGLTLARSAQTDPADPLLRRRE
ncbi:MAG: hypothetical protein ACKO0M_15405, partial [Cyanobium sp.]